MESDIKNFLSSLNKEDSNNMLHTSLSDSAAEEADELKKFNYSLNFNNNDNQNDDLDESLSTLTTAKNKNAFQLDENNYQFFSIDDNDSLLEAIKSNNTNDVSNKLQNKKSVLSTSSSSDS